MSSQKNRNFNFESLEPRLVMSAQALTDFVADLQAPVDTSGIDLDQRIETLTQSDGGANFSNDIQSIREQYNLTGNGQTIAVIDSGIAFDHVAFGEGFGTGHRVVGGYDFAENDTNPYDDGPLGLHGTHVTGIIGGNSDEFQGIAPDVDLVSLRVFDDNGAGEIAWVEQALRWVHENRNAFENPITTVNLSIGTNWNADFIPEAAELEDEFAQLKEDGIFVSVAAGNLFSSFNEAGVSYPAASPFVVPVASHGADGQLSDFSQRNDRVLVAPGEGILSTVPDHIFAGSETDGYLRSSGTSQSAPFVAGASAILREALQNAGHNNIDQDMLYEHFRETADLIHDQVTGSSYHRINLARAIEAAVVDDHGNQHATATNAGVFQGNEVITGVIETTQDSDHFTFTAGKSGRAKLTVGANGSLAPTLAVGANVEQNENQVSFDVVAGKQYRFAVGASEGTGGYQISVGISEATNVAGVFVDNGRLIVRGSAGNDNVELSYGNLINVTLNGQQHNFQRSQIDEVLIVGAGGTDSVSVTLDDFDRAALKSGRLDVYGVNDLTTRGFEEINVDAGVATGRIVVYDSAGNDGVVAGFDSVVVGGNGFQNTATGFDRVTIVANNGGYDHLRLEGTSGDDRFLADGDRNVLRHGQQRIVGVGFEKSLVLGRGGEDYATLRDSAGNDHFVLAENTFSVDAGNFEVLGFGFERTVAVSSQGFDVVEFSGGDSDENLLHRTGKTRLANDVYLNVAKGFDSVRVNAGGGNDIARIYDSTGNDLFETHGNWSRYTGGGQVVVADGFSQVDVVAESGGFDSAFLNGTNGRDEVSGNEDSVALAIANGFTFNVSQFDNVSVDTKAGFDIANLVGSNQRDVLESLRDGIQYRSAQQRLSLINSENINFDGRGGIDEVLFGDFDEMDLLEGFGDAATALLNNQSIFVEDIEFLEAKTRAGESSNYDIAAVDYLFLLDGNWQEDS